MEGCSNELVVCSQPTGVASQDSHNGSLFAMGQPTSILSISPPSALTEAEMSYLRGLYGIPESSGSQLPYVDQRADWDIPGMVCLYEIAFKIGLRLPFPKFVVDVLSYLKVAPGQLMPNAWRLILGMQVLGEIINVQMSVGTFCHFYTVKDVSSNRARVQTNSRPGVDGVGTT